MDTGVAIRHRSAMYGVLLKLSKVMAWAGGLILSALIVMTCVSIIGRVLNGWLHSDWMMGTAPGFARWMLDRGIGPVTGDFELVEAGMAFAIFSFLPLCQMTAGHASVDIFTSRLPDRVNRALRGIIEVIFAAVLILIAVQLFAGMQSKLRSGQTTFLLEMPVWWAYAASLSGAILAALVACYIATLRICETITGRAILPQSEDAP